MEYEDRDDVFGDDDFNDIPAATLNHFEQQARLSTQHGPASGRSGDRTVHVGPKAVSRSVGDDGEARRLPSPDYELDVDEDVIDLDAQPSFAQQERSPIQWRDDVAAREQWRQQRYARPTNGFHPLPAINGLASPTRNLHQSSTAKNSEKPTDTQEASAVIVAQGGSDQLQDMNPDHSDLRSKIHELEQQAKSLEKAAEDARSAAYTKTGEIAIVRANQQKGLQEFERKMKLLQQQHADELARSRAELDVMKKEREKFETNNRFLEHDLARETERARNARRTLKDGNGNISRGKPSPLSTPKKDKLMPLRDGFDDVEVSRLSPSKAKGRSRESGTPKAGSKRKRPQQDEQASASPILSFSAEESTEVGAHDDSNTATLRPFSVHTTMVPMRERRDERFEFVQTILNHRTRGGRDRTLEALTRFFLPSEPKSSLASSIYDRLSLSDLQQELDQFRFQICDVVLSQWTKCLDETYYDPLYELTELLQYILVMSPPSLSANLMAQITPLCQSTTDVIAVATAKTLIDPKKNALPNRTLKSKIDPSHYLDILAYTSTRAALTSPKSSTSSPSLENFWSHIEFDFILTILHRAQPIDQICSMLGLLHSSILPATFGSIYPDSIRQKQMETNLLDRLTKLLTEDPQHARPPPREKHFSDFLRKRKIEEAEYESGALPVPEPYTIPQLLHLRSTLLDLLFALALSEHGGYLIATHSLAIGRLVKFLHESVVKMYSTYSGAPESSEDQSAGDDDGTWDNVENFPEELYAVRAAHTNTIVTLLFHLNSTYGTLTSSQSQSQSQFPNPDTSANANHDLRPVLNIHAYLESQPSSSQAYLVSLSRIAFSEPWGMEAGIDTEVAEMAHEMLDEFVSPEDGEGVLGVFESGR